MKIIVLFGDHHTGKTKTLNDVFKQLPNKANIKSNPSPYLPQNDNEYTFDYNGKYVALVTAGDRRNFIKNIISKYKSVDVLVIAYNKQLPTIYSNIFEADEIYIVQKTNSNQNDCNKIIKLI